MIDFLGVKAVTIPEGDVSKITNSSGEIVWQKPTRLPADYQEVEYIQSSGTQWIDSEFTVSPEILTNGLKAESKVAILGTARSAMYKNKLPYFFVGTSSGNFYSGLGGSYKTSSVSNDGEPHILTLDSTEQTYSVDGTVVSQYSQNYSGSSGGLYLFISSSGSSPLTSKLYYTKIYYQGELVRYFVPCYRKSDNEVGLYDSITGRFFTNAGSEEFSKGPDIA